MLRKTWSLRICGLRFSRFVYRNSVLGLVNLVPAIRVILTILTSNKFGHVASSIGESVVKASGGLGATISSFFPSFFLKCSFSLRVSVRACLRSSNLLVGPSCHFKSFHFLQILGVLETLRKGLFEDFSLWRHTRRRKRHLGYRWTRTFFCFFLTRRIKCA